MVLVAGTEWIEMSKPLERKLYFTLLYPKFKTLTSTHCGQSSSARHPSYNVSEL